jgi:hypothetical protein
MEFAEMAVGYLTGLHLLAPRRLEFPVLLVTGMVVNICNAIMCRLFARNNGYPARLWALLGLIFGMWAVAFLLLFPKRESVPG